MLELDAVPTLAVAGIALFLGYGLCRAIPVLGLVFPRLKCASCSQGATR